MDEKSEIEINRVPISWNLEKGTLSFFGIESALFWTDPSIVNMLSPINEELGKDLFRLLVAFSSSHGTKEDFYNMISTLADNFIDGFYAWGKGVSAAGWGTFNLQMYNVEDKKACIIVKNPWEISVQRNLPPEKRWGAPFLQGKMIGIFSNAFGERCWADDTCYYDEVNPYVEINIFPSSLTIEDELKKLRYEKMMEKEKELSDKVDLRTKELKSAKDELEEYSLTLEKKVSERTAEKDKFISILAHDLRAPFQGLIGLSEILMTDFDSFDNEKANDLIKSIYDLSKNTFSFLEELLEWAKTQQRGTVYNPEKTFLFQIVNDTVSLLSDLSNSKNIQIICNISEDTHAFADKNMLKTIVRNLVTNAIKFTPNAGQVNLSSTKKQSMIEIVVSDSGVGMDTNTIQSLFKIGEIKSKVGTAGERGTGFGLLLCKDYVERHGGSIRVESEIGKGSTFAFTLPLSGGINF